MISSWRDERRWTHRRSGSRRREINALHKNSKKRKQEMHHADKNDDDDSYFNEFNDIDLSNIDVCNLDYDSSTSTESGSE